MRICAMPCDPGFAWIMLEILGGRDSLCAFFAPS